MLTVLGGLAEFERELIRARTGDGQRARHGARAHMGRPPALTPHQRQEAAQLFQRHGDASRSCPSVQCQPEHDFAARRESQFPCPCHQTGVDAETERAARAFMQRLEGKYPVSRGHSLRQPCARHP